MTGGDPDDERSPDHGEQPVSGRSEATRAMSDEAEAVRSDDPITATEPGQPRDLSDFDPTWSVAPDANADAGTDRVTIVDAEDPAADEAAPIDFDPNEPRLPGHSMTAAPPVPDEVQAPSPRASRRYHGFARR